jgi:predicted permease
MNTRLRSLFERSHPKSDMPADAQSRLPAGRLFQNLGGDLRRGFDELVRRPWFSLLAILALTLGLGLNTAFFSFFNGQVLTRLPVTDSASLYDIEGLNEKGRELGYFSFKEYTDLRDQNQVCQEVIAHYSIYLNTPDGPLNGYLVSGNYFDSLGIKPLLGRPLRPDDDHLSPTPAVVLGNGLWKRRYGGDPQIVGRQIELAQHSFTVVGVAANEVEGLDSSATDLWAPLPIRGLFTGPGYLTDPYDQWLHLVGRLKPGVTAAKAEESLSALLPSLTRSRREGLTLSGALLESIATYGSWEDFPWLWQSPMIISFWLVLLIACIGVAALRVAHGLSRRSEIAELFAQGASRGSIVRRLTAESLPLSAAGAVLGLVLSHVLIVLLRKFALPPEEVASPIYAVTLDLRIIAYVLLLSVIVVLIVGLYPALRVTRLSRVAAGSKLQPGRRRLRHGLVIAQGAVILLLVGMAGAIVFHQVKLSRMSLGFDASQALFVDLKRGPSRAEFRNQLAAVPGVVAVANQVAEPLYNGYPAVSVSLQPDGAQRLRAGFNTVSPEYFEILSIPLLQGRLFSSQEAEAKADVAVVSRATAQHFWLDQDPIGKQLTVNLKSPRTVQVVGVVGGVVNKIPVDGPDANFIYLPTNPAEPPSRFLLRVNGDVRTMERTIRTALSTAYPIAEFELHPLTDWVALARDSYKVTAWVSGTLGLCCLLLGGMGIFGALAQEAALRAAADTPTATGAAIPKPSRAALAAGARLIAIAVGCGIILALVGWYLMPDPIIKRYMVEPLVLFAAVGFFAVSGLLAALLCVRQPRGREMEPSARYAEV